MSTFPPGYFRPEPSPPPQAPSKVSPKLSELLPQFLDESVTRSGWTQKTRECHEAALRLLIEILEDPPIGQVGHDHAAKAVAALKRVPVNRTQRGLAGVPLGELAARVERGELKAISDTTVRNLLVRMSPFWSWAVRRDLCGKNYFSGVLRERRKVRPEDERDPFTSEELLRTFKTFRTVQDDFRWFPVVLLYSGLRTGEAAQLTPSDLRTVDGVPCFDVNVKDGKTTKNRNAIRLVPVHPVLIRLGLLKHCEARRNAGGKLLFDLPVGREPSTVPSKRWQYLKKRIGVKGGLHSARHSFATWLEEVGVSLEESASLMGHARSSLETARYAKRRSPTALLGILERLVYPGEGVCARLDRGHTISSHVIPFVGREDPSGHKVNSTSSDYKRRAGREKVALHPRVIGHECAMATRESWLP